MKKIYLAGPDVFLPNAKEHGAILKQICLNHGLIGLFPLDNEVSGTTKLEIAQEIRKANVSLIEEADFLVANLQPFRGPEPDSGTVWELGYAQGLGKPAVCYSSNLENLKARTQKMLNLSCRDNVDLYGMHIENFDLPYNLMFGMLDIFSSFEECVISLKEKR